MPRKLYALSRRKPIGGADIERRPTPAHRIAEQEASICVSQLVEKAGIGLFLMVRIGNFEAEIKLPEVGNLRTSKFPDCTYPSKD